MNNQFKMFRWLLFATVLFTYLVMSSQRTAPGLITDQIMVDFNISAITVGFLISIQYLVYALLQVPMGILADRFGPVFFLVSGAFLTGCGTILYSLSSNEYGLFFARLLSGIGDATIWVNLVLVLGQWFTVREFTRLIGIAAMMGNLGYFLATVPFSFVISSVGWRPSFFSLGLLICSSSIMLFIILILKAKQPLFKKDQVKYEKMSPLLKRIFTTKQAWALFFCHFSIVGTYIGFISSWAVPYGMEVYELSRTAASQLIMIGLTGALIGSPLAGFISSKLNTIKKPYLIFHIIMLFSWSIFLVFKGNPPFHIVIILFFLLGLAYGANSLTFAMVHHLFPKSDAGVMSGFANAGGFICAYLLPILFGKVLDYFYVATDINLLGYYNGFFIAVIFSLIGLFGIFFLKETPATM